MPEHLRALLVIVVLSGVVFWAVSPSRVTLPVATEDYRRRRNAFFATILAAFLTHDFWLFMAVSAVIIRIAAARERNPIALYLAIALAVPPFFKEIPGILGLEHLFALDPPRLLSLLLLLPTWLVLRTRAGTPAFGSLLPDKLLLGFMVVYAGTTFVYDTATAGLRTGMFYPFLDFFLPYYVASRSLRSLAAYRDLAVTLAVVAAALSLLAMFELARTWLLYHALQDALGVAQWSMNNYLFRGDTGLLRAQASTGHSIALGYVVMVSLALFALLRPSAPPRGRAGTSSRALVPAAARAATAAGRPVTMSRRVWWLLAALMAGGLVAALSRGPWVGAASALIVYVALAPRANVALARFGLGAIVVAALLSNTQVGRSVLSFLPFVGTVDATGVTYRQQLFETSLLVVEQRPWFGAVDYMSNPLMEVMRQGEGIIDIVNSYLQVALRNGLVGLFCFGGVFVAAMASTYSAMSRMTDKSSEEYLLGRVLLAAMVGVLVTIVTVSSILMIPMMYWVMAGLLVGYGHWLRAPQTSGSTWSGSVAQPRAR